MHGSVLHHHYHGYLQDIRRAHSPRQWVGRVYCWISSCGLETLQGRDCEDLIMKAWGNTRLMSCAG